MNFNCLRYLFVLLIFLVIFSCSKPSDHEKNIASNKKTLNIDNTQENFNTQASIKGPYLFKSRPRNINAKNIARVGKSFLTMEQVNYNSIALKQMYRRENELLFNHLYSYIVKNYTKPIKTKNNNKNILQKIMVESYIKIPKKFKALSWIQIKYIPKLKQEKKKSDFLTLGKVINNQKIIDLKNTPIFNSYYFLVRRNIFKERVRIIKRLVSRRLLFKLSKEKKVSIDEFIQQYIIKSSLSVSKKDYKEKVKLLRLPKKISMSKKKYLTELIFYQKKELLIKTFVEKHLKDHPVEIYLKGVAQKILIKEKSLLSYGSSDKKVIDYFFKLNCEKCNIVTSQLFKLRRTKLSKYQINYRILFNQYDNKGSFFFEAALCVKDQDEKLFWKFIKEISVLKKKQYQLSIVANLAEGIALDQNKFNQCMFSKKTKKLIQNELNIAKRYEISKPTLIINNIVCDELTLCLLND